MSDLQPGIHDIPMAEYLADPCPIASFSSSAAVAICQRSAMHARHGHPRLNPDWSEDASKPMDLGAAVHAMLLDPDESRIKLIDADDFRTKAARAARDEARQAGLIPLLARQRVRARTIYQISRGAIRNCEDLGWTFTEPRTVDFEQTLIWQESDVWCRGRPDILSKDQTLVVNYKTTATNAEPESFGNGYLIRGGYHIQAFHHLRGVEVLTGHRAKYIWIVQEVEPPYATSFIGMGPSLEALAEQQWNHAIITWRECLHSGEWPGYPNQVCWIDAPVWYTQRWCERPDIVGSVEPTDILGTMKKIGGFVA